MMKTTWGLWGLWGLIKKVYKLEKKMGARMYVFFFHQESFYLLPKVPKVPKDDNVVLYRMVISGDFCFSKLPILPKSPQHTDAAWISTNIWQG
jgi:hypothetical protein